MAEGGRTEGRQCSIGGRVIHDTGHKKRATIDGVPDLGK
jgi:hypothetical protein